MPLILLKDVMIQRREASFTTISKGLRYSSRRARSQARREGVRLVLLWFGLWKNGMSTYIPAWMKEDRQRYFLMRDRTGRAVEAVSPLCGEAVTRDAAAFVSLLTHLREVDEERTVVMVQVENEMGLLGDVRDFSPQSSEAYAQPVPPAVAERYNVVGTWQEAFGDDGPERFMVYHYAMAVERVAAAGKAEYPLPLYVNAWLDQYPWTPGTYPSGGPIAKVMDQWKPWHLPSTCSLRTFTCQTLKRSAGNMSSRGILCSFQRLGPA